MALFQNFTTEIEVCESLVLNTASVCSAKSQFAARGTVLVLAEMNQQEHAERNAPRQACLYFWRVEWGREEEAGKGRDG